MTQRTGIDAALEVHDMRQRGAEEVHLFGGVHRFREPSFDQADRDARRRGRVRSAVPPGFAKRDQIHVKPLIAMNN